MQVEVSVQNCFDNSHSESLASSYADSLIAAETWEVWFHRWLEILQPPSEASAYELSLRLTDDAEIQELNAQYRHQNRPTDVLAFAALEVACPQIAEIDASSPLYLGDIVISVDTAGRQAQEQGQTLQTELAWLAAHGLLHLLGWDHPDEDSLMQMLDRQVILLHAVGLAVSTM